VSEIAFATRGLSKRFGAVVVADDISIEVAAGERRALIGPNGAGKTSFVGLVSGVIKPDAGAILLNGQDIAREPPHRRVRMGLVRTFQVTNLFRDLSLVDNLYLAVSEHLGASSGMWGGASSRRDILDRIDSFLERFALREDRFRKVSEIAYGRQRLVEIALALCLQPKVLILDEPAAGVPSDEAGVMLDALDKLPRDLAILMIEHDMRIVKRFADRITVLVQGAVLMTGAPADVMASEEVRAVYLGRGGHARFLSETSRA
jgi:branched-chain amino acid transport system ATP-binding protein